MWVGKGGFFINFILSYWILEIILFNCLRLLKLIVSLFLFFVLWLIFIGVFKFFESCVIRFCILGLIFFLGLGLVGFKSFFISFFVLCMVRFLFDIICVVFDWVLFFSVNSVLVWFILILLCLINSFMLLFKLFRWSKFVIVVCDLFIVLVIFWWVSVNLFIKWLRVCVFFMVFKFLCWIFLISVMVIVVLLGMFLIK